MPPESQVYHRGFALGLGEPLVGFLFLAWVLADFTLDRE
jgi:hypothetical protein